LQAQYGGVTNPAGPGPLRIGHQEREAAARALDEHLNAGRLDADEYGDRYAKAMLARTSEDLRVLFLDLPQPHGAATVPVVPGWTSGWVPPQPNGAPPQKRWNNFVPASMFWRVVLVAMIVAGSVLAIPVLFLFIAVRFLVIPMLITGCARGHRTRQYYRHYGRPGWYA
jgi:hypothetical protein